MEHSTSAQQSVYMETSIKSVSIRQIEEAFSKALTALLGEEYEVSVSEVKVSPEAVGRRETATFAGSASKKADYSSPFSNAAA